MSDQKITVYSKPGCVQCSLSIRHLEANDTPYEVLDMSVNDDALATVKELGYLQAPVLVAPNGHWSGFRPDMIDQAAAMMAA